MVAIGYTIAKTMLYKCLGQIGYGHYCIPNYFFLTVFLLMIVILLFVTNARSIVKHIRARHIQTARIKRHGDGNRINDLI